MRKGQHKKNLTDSECNNLLQHPLTRCIPHGKIPMGAADEMAKMFGCTPATVELTGSKTICRPVHQRKKGQSGRKPLHYYLPERIQAIPQSRRYCFRSVAHALGIPKSTLHAYFKRGVIAQYLSVLKDVLDRVKQGVPPQLGTESYQNWFFMTRLQKKVIGATGEKIKQRSCKQSATY
ncbi:hypothetical protein DYB28_002626 [Aphanomyces astaci]|uniref:Uncharacterized protein n=1 Tax=Aphanomyces astaci TaxID=112090 RepID=A0A397EPT2_APHAT|nr:hypothetical protein DYB36_013659 [Aphanomyces astaci]RHY55129.1 hypothetical protein DYB30_012204 [Aphanomyces astaci]RHY91868.1 hypothetical protein DYB31_013616 [Aphanomyces astaci]RLO06050.1 hypothetical protein DYB28_002626 [Aphanomyces astaci]